MRKIQLLYLLIFNVLGSVSAQVGVNTENPQGVFHVDPSKNTSGATGTSDDVIVTKAGNVGIGTVNPSKKLEIVSATSGAIRIVDGTQGGGKVLSTDASGTVTWKNVSGGWFAILTGGSLPYTDVIGSRQIPFTGAETSISGVGSTNAAQGRITVPYNGTYRVTLFGRSFMNRAAGYFIAGYFWVAANGTYFWSPHSLGNTTLATDTYVSYNTFVRLNANSILSIIAYENNPGYANAVSDLTMLVEFVQ